jgi:hypothetical protein
VSAATSRRGGTSSSLPIRTWRPTSARPPAAHVERVVQAIAACGGELLLLPAYWPDLSPIEQAFSKVKSIHRRLDPRSGKKLWSSAQASALGTLAGIHWESPIIVGGKVYANGESGAVIAYGLA